MSEETHYDVIVIGGGAAGMMAAGRAAERGRRALLLEKNPKLGKKLSITGGGRCNITNAEKDTHVLLKNYGDSEPILHSPFSKFGVAETFAFFESRGLPLIVEARKRAFPQSQKAEDVVRVMREYLQEGGVVIRTQSAVRDISVADGRIVSILADQEYSADTYIFATGGLSHPETGSTGDGFAWLKRLGHTVHIPTPTIVPLRASDEWLHNIAGKTISGAKITFFVEGEKRFALRGDILITHFGLSGPTMLNAAGQVADLLQEGVVDARIDTMPDFDIGVLDKRMTESFDAQKNKALKNALREITPAGTTETLLSLVPQIDPEKKVHSITKEERRVIVDLLKSLPVHIVGLMGFDRAVVADGGVPLDEVDEKTMRSRKIENLFLIGDILHIRRPSGGFSLQLCWTTGFVAGEHA
ncbi:MAG TPA: aminoacetone oxidase family FAD-binding enzyme [Candidatus Paceibacterota bacterium]|nr:aminoacetone oxidase family FAD-binding enzyme [Candidatus Paceibacterota bacterium]